MRKLWTKYYDSVGLALIHLLEKALKYIPDAIDVLSEFFGPASHDFYPGYIRHDRTQYLQLLRKEIVADSFLRTSASRSVGQHEEPKDAPESDQHRSQPAGK
jgi:hypothetical protein